MGWIVEGGGVTKKACAAAAQQQEAAWPWPGVLARKWHGMGGTSSSREEERASSFQRVWATRNPGHRLTSECQQYQEGRGWPGGAWWKGGSMHVQALGKEGGGRESVAFKIYDMDGDGFIGAQELYQTLSTLVGRTIPDAHLEQGELVSVFSSTFFTSSFAEFWHSLCLFLLFAIFVPYPRLQQIALNTMREYDVDGDDKLSLHEFKNLLSTTDLQHKFSLTM
eukprot:1160983-Pelagomonas_calceolata.AAC.14